MHHHGSPLNLHTYEYNVGNQRTKQTRSDGSYVDYTYDAIGQLGSAEATEADTTTSRLHEQLGYGYDDAGNLQYRTNNALIQTFNVNSLNELTTVTRDGTLTVAGTTTSEATSVTVNSQTATLYDDYTFAKAGFSLSDGNNAFTAVAQDSLGRQDSQSITVYLPATASYSYDDNGNLVSDGKRGFEYDDENQLIKVTVTNAWKSEFSYDGKLRRRIRKEYKWQSSAWVQTNEVRYVYDGNLVIQERDGNNLALVSYTRGKDLSGSLEGAGGIGGLLARTDNSLLVAPGSMAPHAYYHVDGNGNVTALVSSNQLLVAKYAYDPYGNTLAANGPLAEANLYRFSSKECHPNTGLVYYLYRYYDPNFQRWLNHDPIGEWGGVNLYGFVGNDPISMVDLWGLKKCYKWMLMTFYTGQKPKTGRNSWNKKDLTEMDAAVGLGGYKYNSDKKCSEKVGPSRGSDDYAYPPETEFIIRRGKKGSDKRTVRDGGSGWVYPRPGAPKGVGQDEWLDLWTPKPKQGIEVDLVEWDVGDKSCPEGWSEDPKVAVPENLQNIKSLIGQ